MNNESTKSGDMRELLLFKLGGEDYAVDILRVQEICITDQEKITRIANSPEFVTGVTNLRGVVVPVIDLRKKFNLKTSVSDTSVIIVVNLKTNDQEKIAGFVVDDVSEVMTIANSDINDPPEYAVSSDSGYIEGIATFEGNMLIIMNMQKLIDSDNLNIVDSEKLK